MSSSAIQIHASKRVKYGWWQLDRQRRQCTIDAGTEVGQDIAKLFAGYLAKEFGETSFTVRHRPRSQRAEVARR